ncbi:hypothetical protein [Methylosinus sp. Ce-a6]|uniref:hypothetical protein n=1 Tax=Methylosinus sp. Ce-a6 TaxID=2172005 RepID=UPI001359DD46|nr:hypothetical protein [Methylosinus sp. Ce-a6]
MLRLLRNMLSLLALASLLLGGPTARERHSCEGMSAAAMEDCHKSGGGNASLAADDCAALFCAQMQAAPAPPEAASPFRTRLACAPIAPPSDADLAGLIAPPDLRPPIA